MNKMTDRQFDKLLEESLRLDFNSEIANISTRHFNPSPDFQNKMAELFRKENAKKFRPRSVLKKVAVFFLVLVGGFALLSGISDTAKANFQIFIDWLADYREITWHDDHISIEVSPKEEDRVEFSMDYIPDGYNVIVYEELTKLRSFKIVDEKDQEILLTIVPTNIKGSKGFDNEHTEYTTKEINSKKYLLGRKIDGNLGNYVLVEHQGYYYEFYSRDYEIDDLIAFAENIFKNMEKNL